MNAHLRNAVSGYRRERSVVCCIEVSHTTVGETVGDRVDALDHPSQAAAADVSGRAGGSHNVGGWVLMRISSVGIGCADGVLTPMSENAPT